MNSMYEDITNFMKEYVETYSQYGQIEKTHRLMDKFYAPELSFPDDGVTSRDQWYERCLNHPAVQDKLTLDHLVIDEQINQIGALLKTQAIERSTGNILLELRMNVLYKMKINKETRDIKITEVQVFLESDPAKVTKLTQLYKIGK
jgi:hypothetical protein